MLNYNDAFYQLRNALHHLYDGQEAAAIAHEVLQHITGMDKLKRLVDKDKALTAEQENNYHQMQAKLLSGKPLQYVTGHAWFMNRAFMVNENVLIPRPETEELVGWILQNQQGNKTILDIGTGSGCIPVSLKLAMPQVIVTACDISEGALSVAQYNAKTLHADIQFVQLDFLQSQQRDILPSYDVIVSNPPYIPVTEKETLHTNVRDHEPGTALFVPGDDPLLFYREIALFGKTHLNSNGAIYCELHAEYALATKKLFEEMNYSHVTIKKDMHGNLRMLKAQ